MENKNIIIGFSLLVVFAVGYYEYGLYEKHRRDEISKMMVARLTEKIKSGGCNQSATTTDCSKIRPTVETPDIPIIKEETEPIQSEKIDEHLTINNELRDVNFCGKTYKVKQVLIDGVDVMQRMAEMTKNSQNPWFCKTTESRMPTVNHTTGNEIAITDREKNTFLENEIYAITPIFPTGINENIGDFLINITTGNVFVVTPQGEVSETKFVGKLSPSLFVQKNNDDILLLDIASLLSAQKNTEKNYKSPAIGISFQYPLNDIVVETQYGVSITTIPPNISRRHSSASMGNLIMHISEGKKFEPSPKEVLSSKDIFVDGHRAKEITSLPDGYSGSIWIYLLVEAQKGTLKIQYLRDSVQAKDYKVIIESIHIL
jgi:hypothetical protein